MKKIKVEYFKRFIITFTVLIVLIVILTFPAFAASSPFISIISPALADTFGSNENIFLEGQTIPITVSATGSIARIEVYDGTTLLCTYHNTNSFTYNWESPPVGEHYIYVKGHDKSGQTVQAWTYLVVESDTPTKIHVDSLENSPYDGNFDEFQGADGKTFPTGWSGDIKYSSGGRINKGFNENDSTNCLVLETVDDTKDISPYIEVGNVTTPTNTLVYEMDIKRGFESDAVALRTIIAARTSTGSIPYIFFIKSGAFTAAIKDETGQLVYRSFGVYERNKWHHVRVVMNLYTSRMARQFHEGTNNQ